MIHVPFTQEAINKGFNPEKPIVFLDIDGVLNSRAYAIRLREKDPRLKGIFIDKIDPTAIENLNEIADWNFVVSSTWRRFKTIEQLNKIFTDMGFKGKLLDKTPTMEGIGIVRGNEIHAWMLTNLVDRDTRFYVIFDDDSDMLYWQRENYINVDNAFGLSHNHVYRAKRIMR